MAQSRAEHPRGEAEVTAEECRQKAKESLQNAETATPHRKAEWVAIATQWAQLAERIETKAKFALTPAI